MKTVFFFLVILSISCTQVSKVRTDRRNLNEYFSSSGVVQYLLPQLPNWANFSHSGVCRRNRTTRFLDFERLRNSLSFSYSEAIHFQHLFNIEIEKKRTSVTGADHVPLKDEEEIFYAVFDKIRAGIHHFRVPTFKRIHLVWIDFALNNKASMIKLKKHMQKDIMLLGHPVFVSLCLNQKEMEKFVRDTGFDNSNVRLIPFEMMSPYEASINKLGTEFSLNFNEIFQDNQELYFFTTEKELPHEFVGKFKLKKI